MYISASGSQWSCKCKTPVPSEDGKTPISLTQPESKRNSANLLAGGAAAAVGLNALSKDREQPYR
jgi:hypothetical protein